MSLLRNVFGLVEFRRTTRSLVDDDTPAEVSSIASDSLILVFGVVDLNQTAGLKVRDAIVRMLNDGSHIPGVSAKLLSNLVVVLDGGLIGDAGAITLLLQRHQFLLQLWDAGSVLELVETSLQHELG